MDECAGRLLECVCGARALPSKCLEGGHFTQTGQHVFSQNICRVCKFKTRAMQHTCQCLHASRSRSVQAASEGVRRNAAFILGTSEKRTRWRRQHIERWLRSILQLKIRRYGRSFHSNWPALGRPQRLANTLRLSSVIPFPFFFFLSFSTLEYFATE